MQFEIENNFQDQLLKDLKNYKIPIKSEMFVIFGMGTDDNKLIDLTNSLDNFIDRDNSYRIKLRSDSHFLEMNTKLMPRFPNDDNNSHFMLGFVYVSNSFSDDFEKTLMLWYLKGYRIFKFYTNNESIVSVNG